MHAGTSHKVSEHLPKIVTRFSENFVDTSFNFKQLFAVEVSMQYFHSDSTFWQPN